MQRILILGGGSEVVELDTLKNDKLNIIKAPTGSGKTFFALTAIPATLTDAVHQVVYLIDTINGKEQILKNYNARSIYHHWDVEVKDDALFFETDERIVIITYAKFGILLEKYPDFHTHFEYIICDELHSLFNFARFGQQPNAHSIAKRGIERAVRNGHTKVIALSATPERIKREFDAPYCDVPVDDSDLIHYETRQVIPYTNLDYLLTTLEPSETGLCYVSHITTMKAIEAEARELGLNPISIWYRLWLLSNAQRVFTAYELRLLGLGDQLDGIYISSNYQCRKPDLRFYQALIDERNLDVSKTLMIGNDRQTDIAGARAAGMATLYMHTALTPADQAEADEKKAIGVTDGREYEFEGDNWAELVELILAL